MIEVICIGGHSYFIDEDHGCLVQTDLNNY